MIKMPWNRTARVDREVEQTSELRKRALSQQRREMRKLIQVAFGRAVDGGSEEEPPNVKTDDEI